MANTYLISDGFYKDNFPMNNLTSSEKFYSCVLLEQKTTLLDFLGKNLYENLFSTIVLANPAQPYQAEFLESIQYLMVWYTAKALAEFDREIVNENNINSIRGKIRFYEGVVHDLIADTPELVAIQADDTEPSRDSVNAFPTYFFR